MVDELKKLNLGIKEPCPIYVSTILVPKEDGEYFKILSEFRSMFA